MLEVLESLERVAVRLSPIVLVLPGLILTALGLFVWLGGLGFRRLLMGLVGALAGGVLGYSLAGRNVVVTVAAALALTFVAAIFQRLFAAVILGVLAAAVVFLVLAWPFLQPSGLTVSGQVDPVADDAKATVKESLEIIESHWNDLAAKVRHAAGELPPPKWLVVAVVGLGILALGFVFRRLGGALSCATVGTVLVFLGLVLLLMFKGSTPVTRIESRAGFYGLVFASMVGFGTLEQFVLCRRAESRRRARSERSAGKRQHSKRGWRNK